MSIPYELYIRYLATRGYADLHEVNAKLAKLRLRPISQENLDKTWMMIHATMPLGITAQIESKIYSSDFLKHMQILEVAELWETPEKGLRPVFDIHEDLSLRLTVNALLVKYLKLEEITRLINAKFTTALRESHVNTYMRYFFDPRRMTRGDWRDYLKDGSSKERSIIFMALTEEVNILKTELDLPATISVPETLQWLITKSFTKARNYMNVGGPESDQAARAWTDQVLRLAEKYEKYRSADQHDFSKSLQMEFDFLDDEFDTPDNAMLSEVAASRSAETPDKVE